jgi:hypothetical protein
MQNLLRGGARIGSNNEGIFDRELGVFQPWKMDIRPDPQDDHEDGENECNRFVSN